MKGASKVKIFCRRPSAAEIFSGMAEAMPDFCAVWPRGGRSAMCWNALFFFNSAALGVGLAMDAFSVSLVNGLTEPAMSPGKMAAVSGVFAFFQALMPMMGWLCVRVAARRFVAFTSWIPWIAVVLLLCIGGSMLRQGICRESAQNARAAVTAAALLVQGVATSIDALSVGFAIAHYGSVQALVCAVIIAAVTWLICAAGLLMGRRLGTVLADRAFVIGGVILIAVGGEIFLSGL